ncbi:MAG: hypothetical protein ABJH04_07990 [Cyclobacteriaceae bacterium]
MSNFRRSPQEKIILLIEAIRGTRQTIATHKEQGRKTDQAGGLGAYESDLTKKLNLSIKNRHNL